MEKELEYGEQKLQKRDDSMYSLLVNLNRMRGDGDDDSSASSLWCADLTMYLELLESFIRQVDNRVFLLPDDQNHDIILRNLVVEKSLTFCDESSSEFFESFSKCCDCLPANQQLKEKISEIWPTFSSTNTSSIEFKQPRRNIRKRPSEEQQEENNNNEEQETHQSNSLFCELELCTRVHLSRLLSSSSSSSLLLTEQEKRDIQWSIFCRDFGCPLHHHFEIPRRFALGLDLLCFLFDQVFTSSSNQLQQQQPSIDIELLSYIRKKFLEAKILFDEIRINPSFQHQRNHHNFINNDGTSSSQNNNINSNQDEDDNQHYALVNLVSEWTLEIANDLTLFCSAVLNNKNPTTSTTTREKLVSITREVQSKDEATEQIESIIGEKMSQLNVAILMQQKQDRDYLKNNNNSSSTKETLLRQIRTNLCNPEKSPHEAFELSCDLVCCLLSTSTSMKKENEDGGILLQQAISDMIQLATNSLSYLTSKSALESDEATTSTLQQRLLLVYSKLAQTLARVAASSSENLEFISSSYFLMKSSFIVLPLDALSMWNLSVFLVSLHLVPPSATSTISALLKKFAVLNNNNKMIMTNLDSYFDLTSEISREFLFSASTQQQQKENTTTGLLIPEQQQTSMMMKFSKCEQILQTVDNTNFFSTTLTTISKDMKIIQEMIIVTINQMRELFQYDNLLHGKNSHQPLPITTLLEQVLINSSSQQEVVEFLSNSSIFAQGCNKNTLEHLKVFRKLIESINKHNSSIFDIAKWFLENWIEMMAPPLLPSNQNQNQQQQSSPKKGQQQQNLPSPPVQSSSTNNNKLISSLSPEEISKLEFWWNGTNSERLQQPNFFAGELLVAFYLILVHKKIDLAVERLKMRVLRAIKHDAKFQKEILLVGCSSISGSQQIVSLLKDCFRLLSLVSSSSSSSILVCDYLTMIEKFSGSSLMIFEAEQIMGIKKKNWIFGNNNKNKQEEGEFIGRIKTFLEGKM